MSSPKYKIARNHVLRPTYRSRCPTGESGQNLKQRESRHKRFWYGLKILSLHTYKDNLLLCNVWYVYPLPPHLVFGPRYQSGIGASSAPM
jgi:hypothetical protein